MPRDSRSNYWLNPTVGSVTGLAFSSAGQDYQSTGKARAGPARGLAMRCTYLARKADH